MRRLEIHCALISLRTRTQIRKHRTNHMFLFASHTEGHPLLQRICLSFCQIADVEVMFVECGPTLIEILVSRWKPRFRVRNNVMGSLQRKKILKNLVGRQEGLMSYSTCQLVPLVRVFVLASVARLFPPGFLASQLCCSESEDSSDLNS